MTRRHSRPGALILVAAVCLLLLAWPQGNSEAQSLFEGLVTTPVPTKTPVPTPSPSHAPAKTPAAASPESTDSSGLDPMIFTLLGAPDVCHENGVTTYVFHISRPEMLLPAMMLLDMEQIISFHYDRTDSLFTLTLPGEDGTASAPEGSTAPGATVSPAGTGGAFSPGPQECAYCLGLGDCLACIGSGSTDCIRCFGSGACSSCDGFGYHDTIYMGEYVQRDCTSCRNGICSKCGGSGTVSCGSCGGHGRCIYCGGSGCH